jgi:hypothetical protein
MQGTQCFQRIAAMLKPRPPLLWSGIELAGSSGSFYWVLKVHQSSPISIGVLNPVNMVLLLIGRHQS